MYPVRLVLSNLYQASHELFGKPSEAPAFIRTEPFPRYVRIRRATALGHSHRGDPISIIESETHSCWVTASKIGPDRYRVREMDIKHTLFAQPVGRQVTFPEGTVLTRDEVVSQFERWTQNRRRERLRKETAAPAAQPAG